MRRAAIVVLLPSLHVAFAATPAAPKTLSVGEATARQVRSSKEHVAVAVQPDGHISEAPAETIQSATTRIQARPHQAVETEVKVSLPKAHETPARKAAEAVTETKPDHEKTMDIEKQVLFIHTAQAEESWKSAFFFFASLVLIVALAVACLFRMKHQQDQKHEPSRPTAQASGSLQSHLNDSSSTSDSGEKIAMLFDRVRQSLEDLSHEKGTGSATAGPGDVAGGNVKGGQI